MWKYIGQKRPDFALEPGSGQESVWDYPRPPKLMPDTRLVEIYSGDKILVSSNKTYRILETASPPTFYTPPLDVRIELLQVAQGSSVCEWKGAAKYWTLSSTAQKVGIVGWSYPDPKPAFEGIRDYFSFYPSALACYVSGERVRPQPGQFYGGWITSEIVGPYKGNPGTEHW